MRFGRFERAESLLGSLRDRPAAQAVLYLGACGLIIAVHVVRYGMPTGPGSPWDGEYRTYAYFSGAFLGIAGVLTVLHGFLFDEPRRRLMLGFGAFLAFLGTAEMFVIHGRLERPGIVWQILYLPVFVLGAIGGLVVLRSLPVRSQVVMALGGACWAVSQVLEFLQWDGDTLVHPALQIYEEVLEALGSTLFGVALLAAGSGTIRVIARRGADGMATPVAAATVPSPEGGSGAVAARTTGPVTATSFAVGRAAD